MACVPLMRKLSETQNVFQHVYANARVRHGIFQSKRFSYCVCIRPRVF